MKFQEIEFNSPAYQQELLLRDAVLRRPLGLNLKNDDLSQESLSWHYGLFREDTLVASVIAVPRSKTRVQLKQMAVAVDHQGQGCGRLLVEVLEQRLLQKEIREIVLHARISALPFYLKLGYAPVGELFEEVGIPHRLMEKSLIP